MPDFRRPDNTAIADAVPGSWVDRLPPAAKPYARLARLDRPIGWQLLLWPCWWGSLFATDTVGLPPSFTQLGLFVIGAIAMRGAGCTWNDILDRDLDAKVARTRGRPLPSGQVTVWQALAFLVVQALIGLAVLMQFNVQTIELGLLSLVVVAVYPLTKRFVDFPQLFLGICFSWGALLGWTALYGTLELAPFALYAGCVLWVIGYDTIYAHQDREDDALVGIGSTARLFGQWTKPAIAVCYAGTVALFAVAYWSVGISLAAWIGLAAGALHLAWQVSALEIDDPQSCLTVFRANTAFGWIVFIGLAGEGLATLIH